MNRAISLPTGKLPADLLTALLARVPRDDARVIVGPGIGQDAAVIDMSDQHFFIDRSPDEFAKFLFFLETHENGDCKPNRAQARYRSCFKDIISL